MTLRRGCCRDGERLQDVRLRQRAVRWERVLEQGLERARAQARAPQPGLLVPKAALERALRQLLPWVQQRAREPELPVSEQPASPREP